MFDFYFLVGFVNMNDLSIYGTLKTRISL